MGIDPNSLPDSFIKRIAEKHQRPRNRLTADEALKKEELRTERDHQRTFRDWLNLSLARNELIYDTPDSRKAHTGVPGFPDFEIHLFGPLTLFVEFKMIPGRMSHEQEMVKGVLESFLFKYFVVHSDKEAIDTVQPFVMKSITARNRAIQAHRQKRQQEEDLHRAANIKKTLGSL